MLEEQVGAGGMAVVFRAPDEGLGRRVAVKVLAPGLAADAAFRRRFIRESRAAAAVDDPHIIPVHEAGDSNGVLFIAMRYVPGPRLADPVLWRAVAYLHLLFLIGIPGCMVALLWAGGLVAVLQPLWVLLGTSAGEVMFVLLSLSARGMAGLNRVLFRRLLAPRGP